MFASVSVSVSSCPPLFRFEIDTSCRCPAVSLHRVRGLAAFEALGSWIFVTLKFLLIKWPLHRNKALTDCCLSMAKSAWTKWVVNLNLNFWDACILVWSVHGIQVEVMFEDVVNFAPSPLLEEWQRTPPGHLARSSSSITLGRHSSSDSSAPYKGSAGAPLKP